MPRLKSLLPALVLAALYASASPAGAQTVTFQRICAPSHVAIAFLSGKGLAVTETWRDDDGWPVEEWSDGGQGRAIVVLGEDDTGASLHCLIFARSPASKKS